VLVGKRQKASQSLLNQRQMQEHTANHPVLQHTEPIVLLAPREPTKRRWRCREKDGNCGEEGDNEVGLRVREEGMGGTDEAIAVGEESCMR
jgi:hypothetical protein